jgi:hypothetical protein
MTLELVAGTNVQVDLKNVSQVAVVVEADQYVVLMEERRRRPLKKIAISPEGKRFKKQLLVKGGSRGSEVALGATAVSPVGGAVAISKGGGVSSRGGSASPEGRVSPKQGRAAGNVGSLLRYDVRKGT